MSAYKRKQNVVFYYWSPTPLVGAMDLVKLDMPPYDAEKHKCLTSPKCAKPEPSAYPDNPVFTAVNAKFAEQAPTLTEFLSKVSVPLPVMNETLAHGRIRRRIRRRGQWFLKNHRDVWASGSPPTSPDACRARSSHPRSRRRPWRRRRALCCPLNAVPGAAPAGRPAVGLFPLGRPQGKRPRRQIPARNAGRARPVPRQLYAHRRLRRGLSARPLRGASAETEPRTCFLKSFPPDRCGGDRRFCRSPGDQLRRYAGKPGATRAARAGVAGATAAQFALVGGGGGDGGPAWLVSRRIGLSLAMARCCA